MTQYCRYCNNMVCGDANYCSVRQETYSEAYIKRSNRCKDFEFNPMDALFENTDGYKPRQKKTGESLEYYDSFDFGEDSK